MGYKIQLRPGGETIPGLFAAGNTTASVMGHYYPGPGATIGAAMTFAYLAALDAAAVPLATERPVEQEV